VRVDFSSGVGFPRRDPTALPWAEECHPFRVKMPGRLKACESPAHGNAVCNVCGRAMALVIRGAHFVRAGIRLSCRSVDG
jgi:hypothetical protein